MNLKTVVSVRITEITVHIWHKGRLTKKTEQRNYDNTMREIQRLENVVEQQRRWGREKNIKTAESKMKVIERLEKI